MMEQSVSIKNMIARVMPQVALDTVWGTYDYMETRPYTVQYTLAVDCLKYKFSSQFSLLHLQVGNTAQDTVQILIKSMKNAEVGTCM